VTASDFAYRSATQLLAAMAAREVSAVELTEAAIAGIERYDGDINAICVPNFDRALNAARQADAARATADPRPLLGVPMTVKESFNVAGLPTTWGIPRFRDFVAAEDAVAVSRVKDAGAVVLGKTNVPFALGDLQTYNDIYGTTNNPWDFGRTPGGSSGGSAAALAAGYGALSSDRTSPAPCERRRTSAGCMPTSRRSGCCLPAAIPHRPLHRSRSTTTSR
jgi:amidase